MLTDMVTTMASGFVVCVTLDPVGMSCPCLARFRVQQLCTVRYKATRGQQCCLRNHTHHYNLSAAVSSLVGQYARLDSMLKSIPADSITSLMRDFII